MRRSKYGKVKLTSESYHLSPQELEQLHRKYGRPGEIAPGQTAPKKRKRLDKALQAMDRKDQPIINEDDQDGLEFEMR